MNAALVVERVVVDAVHEDPENARLHPTENLAAIRASLERHGYAAPLIVRRANGRIIAGNGTYRVLRELGYTHVDVVYRDCTELEAKDLALRLNRIPELATWDAPRVDVLLQELSDAGVPALEVGFRDADLQALLPPAQLPDFEPETAPPPRLDQRKPVTCPNCGHAFAPT